MGIECKIHLTKGSEADYKPGDVVDGKVQYTLDDSTIVTEVVLTLKGKARCYWTEKRGDAAQSYVGTEKLFMHSISLVPQQPPDCKTLIEAGSYTNDFQFMLSDKIPYTFEKSRSTYIAYSLKLIFAKPEFYKRKVVFKKIIKVAPFVDLSSDEYSKTRAPVSTTMTKEQKAFFKKVGEMTATVSLPRSAFVPGDNIPVTCHVHNDTKLTLPCVKTKLVQIRKYTSNNNSTHTKKCTMFKSPLSDAVRSGEQKSFSCELLVPPESSPSLLHCRVLALDYVIRMRVCYPGMRMDAKLDVPIVVCSVLRARPSDQDKLAAAAAAATCSGDPASAPDTQTQPPAYVPPPSYWEVMQLEENEEEGEM